MLLALILGAVLIGGEHVVVDSEQQLLATIPAMVSERHSDRDQGRRQPDLDLRGRSGAEEVGDGALPPPAATVRALGGQRADTVWDGTIPYWPPERWGEVRAVAQCESEGSPAAVSPDGRNWGYMQLNVIHEARAARLGYSWEQMTEPGPNLHVAYSIWEESGWIPWACKEVLHD